MLAAALLFVQVSKGLASVSVDVKDPTSAPPAPLNTKVPPVEGIAPAASIAEYSPLSPSGWPSVTVPDGPSKVMTPASRRVTPGIAVDVGGFNRHAPGESWICGA